jgi:hypothetical protein
LVIGWHWEFVGIWQCEKGSLGNAYALCNAPKYKSISSSEILSRWFVQVYRGIDPWTTMLFTFAIRMKMIIWKGNILTVRLTSIDHPQIGGAYMSILRTRNFIFLACVWSYGEWRTRRNHWICS